MCKVLYILQMTILLHHIIARSLTAHHPLTTKCIMQSNVQPIGVKEPPGLYRDIDSCLLPAFQRQSWMLSVASFSPILLLVEFAQLQPLL